MKKLILKRITSTKRSVYRKILNGFIIFFSFLIAFFLFFLAFSQTYTFREFLRKQVISIANDNLNGKLNIERIDGSILSSVILNKVSLISSQKDTLLYTKEIVAKLSPHKLFFDILYVRKIEIENLFVKNCQDKNGKWDIEKIIKPDPDTTSSKSEFPYIIEANEILLKNINFTQKTFDNLSINQNYDVLNLQDMYLRNFYLDATAIIDIANNNYELLLRSMKAEINSNVFNLKNLSGNFYISPNIINVTNLNIKTDSTDINLSATINGFNIFDGISESELNQSPFNLSISAPSVSFGDINYITGATYMLKGYPSLSVSAEGNLKHLDISNLDIGFYETRLRLNGFLENITDMNKFLINANLNNSNIDYKNLKTLLPWLVVPEYKDLILSNLSVNYIGSYNKFNYKVESNYGDGNFSASGLFDFQKQESIYDIVLNTTNVNLINLINIETNLNSEIKMNGIGFNPKTFNNTSVIKINNSEIASFSVDSLFLTSTSVSQKFNINSNFVLEDAAFKVKSFLDFSDTSNTIYDIEAVVKRLNLSKINNDTALTSNLNFSANLHGTNIDFTKTKCNADFNIFNSEFNKKPIYPFLFHLDLDFVKAENSFIRINSAPFICSFAGKFKPESIFLLIAEQSQVIVDAMLNKAADLNPFEITKKYSPLEDSLSLSSVIDDTVDIKFDFKVNDNNIIAAIINKERFELNAELNGTLTNNNKTLNVELNSNIQNFTSIINGSTFYISNLESFIDLSKNNSPDSFNDIFASMQVDAKRIYTGANLNNFHTDITFNQKKLFFAAETDIDTTMHTQFDGYIITSENEQNVFVENLKYIYNNAEWINRDSVRLILTGDRFTIKNFNLYHDSTFASLDGYFDYNSRQSFNVSVSNLNDNSLSAFANLFSDPYLKYKMDITGTIKGYLYAPQIDLDFYTTEFAYKNISFGKITGTFNYLDEKIRTKFLLLDNISSSPSELNIDMTLPANLSFTGADDRFPNTSDVLIKLYAKNFNVNVLNNIIPGLNNIRGKMNSSITISGSYTDLDYSGYADFIDNYFTLNFNNIEYKLNSKISFEKNLGQFTQLVLENSGDTRYSGKLNATGFLRFKGFLMDELNLEMNGELALLGQKTRSKNPSFYGDLFVETETPIKYKYQNSYSDLSGSVILKQTDIIYSYRLEQNIINSDFVYKFVTDSSKIDKEAITFQKLMDQTKKTFAESDATKTFISNFNYNLNFKIENSARMVFVLSDMLNQKLIVETTGGFSYSKIDGVPHAQGSIVLLSGSSLDFYKKFDASGSLRFESDITNPFMDITAVYQNDYYSNTKVEPVAVKTRIYGTLSDLSKILTSKTGNIKIYRGENNIKNNIADNRYDFNDAILFLITNRFKDDLNQGQDFVSQQVQSSATAIAGTLVSDYLNSSFNGLINNVNLAGSADNRVQQQYIYSLSGRYKKFKYTFGGSFGTSQDAFALNRSNFRVEYLFNPNISLRAEQKLPIGLNKEQRQPIQELGFKYIIEF